jgi:hypothetical protein
MSYRQRNESHRIHDVAQTESLFQALRKDIKRDLTAVGLLRI